ncbi:DUF2254 domain-containing protein [Micrococcales bacterium 31B]|nr:DUF2254 domain-containing protein [Micrococcales bacterium 31B]
MTRWLATLEQITRDVWFRAALFTLAAIALAVLAGFASSLLPGTLPVDIGQGSVASILDILASSMLAVTTFSLTTMVAAYSAAASAGTQRSWQLYVRDTTSQNALSTYIGAFAFSIVGKIALSLELYSPTGEALLFVGAIAVICVVLANLLSWISFLTTFGRIADVIDRVGRAARTTMTQHALDPLRGCAAWSEPPATAHAVMSDTYGYVTEFNPEALQHLAKAHHCKIWVLARPGSRATPAAPLALISGDPTAEHLDQVRGEFVIAPHRTFDEDPRLGLIVLSEIASKALSPGINDPGTAIEVLTALQRVLALAQGTARTERVLYPRVHLPAIEPADLVLDAFRPTARDGAGCVEVAVRLQKEIAALLAATTDDTWRAPLIAMARSALERASGRLTYADDLAEVSQACDLAVESRPR